MRLAHWIGCLSLALPLAGCGCGNSDAEVIAAGPGPDTAVVEVPEVGNPEDAKDRSRTRWEVIAAGDWVQAYDFLSPARKKQQRLGEYLAGKEDHEYRNPTDPILLGAEGDEAYIELSVLWTPHHAILGAVDNMPDDLTDQLDMVETWTYVEGEWYFTDVGRQKEFLADHPNLGK
jgi:hypothetical protein